MSQIGEGFAFLERMLLTDEEFEFLTKNPLMWMCNIFTDDYNEEIMQLMSSFLPPTPIVSAVEATVAKELEAEGAQNEADSTVIGNELPTEMDLPPAE